MSKILVFIIAATAWLPSTGQTSSLRNTVADSLFAICEQTVATAPENVIAIATRLLATQQPGSLNAGKCNYYLGKAGRHAGRPDTALHYLQAATGVFRACADTVYECRSLRETGAVHYLLNENDKALQCYSHALALASERKLVHEIISLSNNIGNLYDKQGHYDKAVAQYENGLKLHPDGEQRAVLLLNMAKAHTGLGKLDKALQLYQESAAICRSRNDAAGVIAALNGVASVYWNQERDDEVLKVSASLLRLLRHTGAPADLIETHNRMGLAYLNLGNTAMAINHFMEALAPARRIAYPKTHYIYANLAFAYEQAGQYKQAYRYFTKHRHLQDSIENIEKHKQLEDLLAKYEADKKERQITLLQQEKQLQTLKLQQQRAAFNRQAVIRNSIIIIASLLLVLSVTLLIFYRQRMQSNLLLAAKTEEVNRQHILELIHGQEIRTIKANMEGRENERRRIARELHDGVAGSLAGIKLHLVKIAETHAGDAGLQKVIKNVDVVYGEVRNISHNLNPPRVLDTAFIDLLRDQLAQLAENSGLRIDLICHPEEWLNQLPDALKIEVYRIVQELVTNIVKHAEAGSVEIQFTRNDDATVNLMVEDNGKGFDRSKLSFGQGLTNIQTRVNQINGTLHIESHKGRGTIVNIDIPVHGQGTHPVAASN